MDALPFLTDKLIYHQSLTNWEVHCRKQIILKAILGGFIFVAWWDYLTPARTVLAAVIVRCYSTNVFNGVLTILVRTAGCQCYYLFVEKCNDAVTFFKGKAVFLVKLLGAIIIASVIYLIYDSERGQL